LCQVFIKFLSNFIGCLIVRPDRVVKGNIGGVLISIREYALLLALLGDRIEAMGFLVLGYSEKYFPIGSLSLLGLRLPSNCQIAFSGEAAPTVESYWPKIVLNYPFFPGSLYIVAQNNWLWWSYVLNNTMIPIFTIIFFIYSHRLNLQYMPDKDD
jgi:hypothetical protein